MSFTIKRRGTGQTSVEIPVGRLAAPGLIDWANVHLALDGQEVPFAIREGRVHWKANLTAPITQPRAEDLLVFPVAVPQGQWLRVEVLPGKQAAPSALKREGGASIVSYPNLKVTVNEASGMLTGLESAGTALLESPLGVDFYTVAAGTIERVGGVGAGYDPMIVKVKKDTKTGAGRGPFGLVLLDARTNRTELHSQSRPGAGVGFDLSHSCQRLRRDLVR